MEEGGGEVLEDVERGLVDLVNEGEGLAVEAVSLL